jgi:hypothetical protein
MRTTHDTYEDAVRAGETEHKGRYKIIKCKSMEHAYEVLSSVDLCGHSIPTDGYPSKSCASVVKWLVNDPDMRAGLIFCMENEKCVYHAGKRFLKEVGLKYSPSGHWISHRAVMHAMVEIENEEIT